MYGRVTIKYMRLPIRILYPDASTSSAPSSFSHLSVFWPTITTVYSFFFDKANGKPDLYSLISCAAFAIMSLSLSKQTHFGFEIDLLYFFCGYLTLQLMKIKLFLVIVGVIFSYFLIILRFYLGNQTEIGHRRLQIHDPHAVVIQVRADSESAPFMNSNALRENTDFEPITQVILQSLQDTSDSDQDCLTLGDCKKVIVKTNEKLNQLIWKRIIMKEKIVLPDNYISMKTLRIKEMEEIADYLHKTVKNMVDVEFISECCNMYNIFRSKFIDRCLCRLGLQEVNLCNPENENIKSLIRALHIALNTLLPNERMTWHRVFSGFSTKYCIFSSSEWMRLEIELWAKLLVLETCMNSNSQKKVKFGFGVHPLTLSLMNCIEEVSEDSNNMDYVHIPYIIQLLQTNLDARSKTHINSTLGHLFMLNNNRYIQVVGRRDSLRTLLGDDWTQLQGSKLRQNIGDFLKGVWRKVFKSMNTKSIGPEDAIATMKLFNQNFLNVCEAQSTCSILDVKTRKFVQRYTKKIFMPKYEVFIGRFTDIVGKDDADQYINYGMLDITDKFNHLYLESEKKNKNKKYWPITQCSTSTMKT
ncbi:exocyst complex component EXO70B1-like [Lathyrus oleraceus]|uniref:exocyst complex component EXO70B1-like n=1 Tax=Pisum sativum TaxID=3888 RepID=UPI0021D2F3BB|nr:exocyst complex component EXO70B1-like [Pisum sativum]